MRKLILLFALLLGPGVTHSATLTDPVVNLGTITDNGDTPSTWSFAVTGGDSYIMTNTGGASAGSGWVGGTYTPFNATNLRWGGQNKYVHIQLEREDPQPEADEANCGRLSITGLKVRNNSGEELHAAFQKRKNGPNITIQGYENGIFFPFNATVVPYSNKGTCTITKTYSVFGFAEGNEQTPSTDYTPFNITFSVTIVTPVGEVSLEHDVGESLSFGTIVRSNQVQVITVNTSGEASSPSPSYVPSEDVSADSFTVISSSGMGFSVNLPSSVTISNGNNSMTVTDLVSSCDSGCSVSAGGSTSFTVGGTLTVPANQPIGEYSGNYTASVTY